MSSKTTKLTPLPNEAKKKQSKSFFSSVSCFFIKLAQLVYTLSVAGGGYVLLTQGAVYMRVVGSIMVLGSLYVIADKFLKD